MTIKDLINDPTILSSKETSMNEILTTIRNGLETDVSMEDVSKLMKEKSIQRYIQFMLTKKLENEVVTGPEKENLLDIIFILQTIYNNSGQDTGVSDYDYDRLYELLNNSGEELISSSIVTVTIPNNPPVILLRLLFLHYQTSHNMLLFLLNKPYKFLMLLLSLYYSQSHHKNH